MTAPTYRTVATEFQAYAGAHPGWTFVDDTVGGSLHHGVREKAFAKVYFDFQYPNAVQPYAWTLTWAATEQGPLPSGRAETPGGACAAATAALVELRRKGLALPEVEAVLPASRIQEVVRRYRSYLDCEPQDAALLRDAFSDIERLLPASAPVARERHRAADLNPTEIAAAKCLRACVEWSAANDDDPRLGSTMAAICECMKRGGLLRVDRATPDGEALLEAAGAERESDLRNEVRVLLEAASEDDDRTPEERAAAVASCIPRLRALVAPKGRAS